MNNNIWVTKAASKAFGQQHKKPFAVVKNELTEKLERVDVYLETRDPSYPEHVAARTEQLERQRKQIPESSPQLQSFLKQSRSDPERACQVIGTRWSYLDIIVPDLSEHVEELVSDGLLGDAADFKRNGLKCTEPDWLISAISYEYRTGQGGAA